MRSFAAAPYTDELIWLTEVAKREGKAGREAAEAAQRAAEADPENEALRAEAEEAEKIAREKSVPLNFFRGTWGSRETAKFLGLAHDTVRHRRAGLSSIPVIRYESGGTGKKNKIQFRPADVIAYRERMERDTATREMRVRRMRA